MPELLNIVKIVFIDVLLLLIQMEMGFAATWTPIVHVVRYPTVLLS